MPQVGLWNVLGETEVAAYEKVLSQATTVVLALKEVVAGQTMTVTTFCRIASAVETLHASKHRDEVNKKMSERATLTAHLTALRHVVR